MWYDNCNWNAVFVNHWHSSVCIYFITFQLLQLSFIYQAKAISSTGNIFCKTLWHNDIWCFYDKLTKCKLLFAWNKKAGFLPFFHIGQSCRNPVSPSVQPKGLTASLFLRVFFGFSSGWHSFPILVVERVAARINQVVECLAAVMVAKTVVDGFVSDKSVFVCRHDGICLKGFVLLLVFVSQKYTTICAIYLRRWRKMHFFHNFRSFFLFCAERLRTSCLTLHQKIENKRSLE